LAAEIGAPLFAMGELRNQRTVFELSSGYLLELDKSSLPNGQVEYEVEVELRADNQSLAEARQILEPHLLNAGIAELLPSKPKYHRFLDALADADS
jgi:uncharacterized protein YjbK